MSKTKCPKVNIRSRETLPEYTDAELTLLAERIGMTLDQLKRYGEAAWRTYGAISDDLHCGPESPGTMKRATIVEIALDASHIDTYGGLEPDLVEWRAKRFDHFAKLEFYYAAVAAVAFRDSEYE